jgi:hypothetical protein
MDFTVFTMVPGWVLGQPRWVPVPYLTLVVNSVAFLYCLPTSRLLVGR